MWINRLKQKVFEITAGRYYRPVQLPFYCTKKRYSRYILKSCHHNASALVLYWILTGEVSTASVNGGRWDIYHCVMDGWEREKGHRLVYVGRAGGRFLSVSWGSAAKLKGFNIGLPLKYLIIIISKYLLKLKLLQCSFILHQMTCASELADETQ